MTSLAKQLQRLAVPHTQAVLGEDRWKASLLFDFKEAASIDKETYHALGLNGLEELETIDPVFHEFIGSLFGDSALTFERSIQTKEVNEKLNGTIRRFLIFLSPYCLLKPAQKTLEWLIHRYHIHFYNVDDLLMCFLPYHESKVFVRVLQLLKFDNKIASKWDWLQPLQKAGVHLTRLTLVNHCRTNPAFLSYICNMIPITVKVHQDSDHDSPKCRVLFSFYATTIISVIDSGNVKEEFVAVILPHLSRGMKLGVAEYKAASYMILAQLLHSTKLKSDILKTLQQIVAKSLNADLMGEGLACLLLMFQNQDMSSIKLSKRSFKSLCRHFSVIDTLAQLAEQFDFREFLSGFLYKLVPAAFKHAVGMATSGESGASSSSESGGSPQQYLSMLHRLLLNIKLPDDIAKQVALNFLDLYVQQGSKFMDEDVEEQLKESLQGIVRQLEGRYSTSVDEAVKIVMSRVKKTNEKCLVKKFLNEFVLSVPHHLIVDTDAGLVLSLNHRLPAVRQTAVSTLIQSRDEVEDKEFFRDSVIARLKDDDPDVVAAVLQLGKELWTIIGDDTATMSLLKKSIRSGLRTLRWEEVATLAAKILGDYNGEKSKELLSTVVSLFFLTEPNRFHQKVIETLLTSKMTIKSAFMKKIAAEWKKVKVQPNNIGEINSSLCECFGRSLLHIGQEEGLNLVSSWIDQAECAYSCEMSCLLMITLDCVITMATDNMTKLRYSMLQVHLTQNIMKLQKKLFMDDFDLPHVTCSWSSLIGQKKTILATRKIPYSFCGKVINTLVDGLQIPPELNEMDYWQLKGDNSCEDMFLKLYVLVYGTLLEKASATGTATDIFRKQLILFEQKFPDSVSYMKFHSLLWTQHSNDFAHDLHLTPVIQARSLKLGHAAIQSMEGEATKAVAANASSK